MTRFHNTVKKILKARNLRLVSRHTAAVILMLAILMPTAAPIPAWAYDLNLPRVRDNGFRLTLRLPLTEASMNFFGSLFNGMAAFISPSVRNGKKSETAYNKESLERTVKGIETQLIENQTTHVGQVLSLAAIPVDKSNNPVNGLAPKWETSDTKIVSINNDSQAIALKAGEVKLTVSFGKFARDILINVLDRHMAASSKTAGIALSAMISSQPLLSEQQAENMVTPENNLGNPPGQTEMSSLSAGSAARTRERYGSSNYSFDIPVASLPGRGIDAGIGLTYNSRVWNKSVSGGGSVFDFNIDRNWLAPGFEMTLGELEGYSAGSGFGYLLTDPDGTRHQLVRRGFSGSCTTYESTDGTFIQTTTCGNYGAPSMLVIYPDGSQLTYGAITQSGKRFPITILDRNGNYISVTYIQNDTVGKIANIRDTLNRYIIFHYDNTADKKLVTVTVPGYNDSPTPRQTIRFYYESLALQTAGRFDSSATVNAPATVDVLKYVYFPGTQTGFRYDYSPYFGIIHKIWQLRGMQITSNSLEETGSVIGNPTGEPDNWAAWTRYNYAAIAMETGPPLSDVPKYNRRYDDWKGRTTDIAQTWFSTEESVTPSGCQVSQGTCTGTRTTTIAAPDGTKSISVSKIRPAGDWENGLLEQTRLVTGQNETERIWSKTKMYWQQGLDLPSGRDNPRLEKIEVTNEADQTRATTFSYDGYNNQTAVKEYDFAPAETPEEQLTQLRRTETTYETGAGWINNRQLRLPKMVKTFVNSIAVSKVEYEYDNYIASPLADTPGVMQHNNTYSPYSGTYICNCRWECPSDLIVQTPNPCPDGSPPVWTCSQCPYYNPATAFRGNVTKITAFSDATLESDPNAVETTMKYDMTGNVIETSAACCREKAWTYNLANGYAYPVSEAMGDQGQLVTSVSYDRNTGLIKTTTDENLQSVTLTHNPDNLRLIRTDSPNGAWATTEYNDADFPYHVKSTSSLDPARSVSSWSFSDGRGQGFRQRSQTAGGYLSSDVEFDIIGRPIKGFNPYTVAGLNDNRPDGIKFTEIAERDGLGRTLKTKLPDLTEVTASYNGLVATATDQAGKMRRQTADVLGRVTRVDEPNADGLLDVGGVPVQPTYYEYDGNDNLTKVTQAGNGATQERLFKYDSLSRLTHERQVEAMATLDNSGIKVGSGGLWTGFYKYNTDNLLEYGVDARGVQTAFAYDGLNRVQTVTYTGETGYQTPQVTYTYSEAETGFYNTGRLTKVQTAANVTYGTPETVQNYDYDKVGQVKKHSQSIGNQVYNLEYGYNLAGQLTSEKYPSGKVVTNTIDNFGVTQTIADAQRTYLNDVTFDNRGVLSQINFGNGTSETYSHNDRFQMESQTLKKGADVLQKYAYSYGQTDVATGAVDATKNNGQLGKIESFIGASKQASQRFAYDELGRLSESREHRGDDDSLTYKQKFDFDRFGNLYRKAGNNLPTESLPYLPIEDADISKSTNRFTAGAVYDEAGQVIVDTKFRSMGFAYDANGRNVKVSAAGIPDTWTVYDALGNRVATKVNDIWQYMIYDAFGKLVAEYGLASGTGGVKYIQQDWQGSVRAVTNTSGVVVSRTDHQAFGEEIGAGVGMRTAAQGYGSSSSTRQGYGLTENDSASGQQHTWFRKLETQAGRWSSPDPYKGSMSLGNPQSFNRYSYVVNEPTNFIDPSGLMIQTCELRGGEIICYSGGGGYYYRHWDVNMSDGRYHRLEFYFPIFSGYNPKNRATGDCAKFADIVESLAAEASSVEDFMNRMSKIFLGQDTASINALLSANTNPSGLMASGFRSEFYDGSPQPRHFTAGYIAGYLAGSVAGAAGMGLNERWGHGHLNPNDDEKADIALNAVSTALGARARPTAARTETVYQRSIGKTERKIPANPGYKVLANQIRERVCAKEETSQ